MSALNKEESFVGPVDAALKSDNFRDAANALLQKGFIYDLQKKAELLPQESAILMTNMLKKVNLYTTTKKKEREEEIRQKKKERH